MASLVKPWKTSYVKNGQRVPKGTPGAKKVKERQSTWFAQVKNPQTGKWQRVPLNVTDKQVAQAKLTELVRKMERGEAGLVDPHKDHKQAPIGQHVEDHLTDLRNKGRDDYYLRQKKRLINTVIAGCQASTVTDLTVEKVDRFLNGLSCSSRTKNTYRQAAIGLVNFLISKGRMPEGNPLLKTTRHKGESKRVRRALPVDGLQRLLDAARQRPLLEALTIRRGPRKGQLGARVKPEDRVRLERIGRQRALLYLTAVVTGLRLGTLRKIRVCHLDLAAKQAMHLPGSIMKSGRDYNMKMRADLVAELKAWIAETGKGDSDLVFDIPMWTQLSKLLKKDLKKAGIPYRDIRGRYFDFHSFRKCTGSFLRQKGVDPSVSMRFLDHSDIKMTMEVYNDEDLLDMRDALDAIPTLTIR